MVLDTNVWIRHLTGDPPEQAELATELIATARSLVLPDVVMAECVYVLESVYGVERWRVAEMMRSALGLIAIHQDQLRPLHSLELYETAGLDYADAYLLAYAEYGNCGPVATFDRTLKARAESVGVLLLDE
ncbi:MAG: PIN domain-containing protein [Solirubrobacterales bacterium]